MEKTITRILYIEDDEDVALVFRAVVEHHGHGVVDIAYTGRRGLAAHATEPYDVIAVDYHLPDMSGVEVCKALLHNDPALPIVMITGSGNQRLLSEALEIGVSQYLEKDGSEVYLDLLPSVIATLKRQGEANHRLRTIEKSRQVSEDRFRDLVELSVNWYWELDERLCYTVLSSTAANDAEYDVPEYLGKSRLDVRPDGIDDDVWHGHINDLVAHRSFRNFIQPRGQKDGSIIWMSIAGKPVLGADGTFLGYRGTATDITHVLKNNEILRRQNSIFEQAEKTGKFGYWVWDEVNDSPLYSSNGLANLDEMTLPTYKKAFRSGSDVLAQIHPDDRNMVELNWAEDWESGEEYTLEYRTVGETGDIRWEREVGVPFDVSDTGEILSSIGVTFDITQQKENEQRLKNSEARFANFATSSSDWFWEMDENLRFIFLSDRFFEISGLKPEDLIGRTMTDSELDMNDENVRQNIDDLKHRRPFTHFEHSRIRLDDSIVYMSTSGLPCYDGDGGFSGYQGTGTDITEQKWSEEKLRENEERFRSMADSSSVAMMVAVDNVGNIVYWNKAAETTFGYSQTEILGRPVTDIIPDRFHDAHDHGLQRALHTDSHNVIGKTVELVALTKNGEEFDIELSLGTWKRGKDKFFSAVIHDITERKHNQAQLQKAKDEAESMNIAKSEFLASMSHELRTPLNAILGFAQMMQYDPRHSLSEAQFDAVDSILAGGHHLLDLVTDILDLAKIEADKDEVFVESIIANEAVSECIKLTAHLGEELNIHIVNHFDTMPQIMVQGDHMRLKQVLINLVSNAVKYNNVGGSVTLDGVETKDGSLRISVTDTGIGIADGKHDVIFQAFYRLSEDRMLARDGTGIGLTVTKLLVERMGGQIGYDSIHGTGSTFWIELPLTSHNLLAKHA